LPAEIRDEILNQVRSFLGEEELQDDLTLAAARMRESQFRTLDHSSLFD
jgi:serine phosphatase RsbU (regulator of sigma subunit)